MGRSSYQDIENRVDEEEELAELNAQLHVEAQAQSEEDEVALAEHLDELETVEALGAALGRLAAVKLGCPPIHVQLVREGVEIVVS